MMHPKDLLIKEFTYELPDERIAKFPLEKRDESKLLVYKNHEISQSTYRNIAQHLEPGSFLLFNNTKVVEARLLFTKTSGGVIEIFCLEPADQYADITTAMMQKGEVYWKCMVGGAGKWKHGLVLQKDVVYDEGVVHLQASVADRLNDNFVIKLEWQPGGLTFAELLHLAGLVPLPPYLHRSPEATDKVRYQTIYAETDGSVAAPTAGLHFTPAIFDDMAAKEITKRFVTLHVGAGTFQPVKSESIGGHAMHSEYIDVSQETIREIRHHQGMIIAVGTTSLRTIESLYWMGLKTANEVDTTAGELMVHQWDAYEIKTDLTASQALEALIGWMEKNSLQRLITKTQIMIAPGYSLKVAKGLITNFHQPQSTLLLLIAAVVGPKWKDLYQYALDNDFRFLSYGDGCLLFAE